MKIDSNKSEKMYSPKEIGAILNISKTTVYRLAETRKLPFYKINGSLRFSQGDVLKFLENNRIESIC